MRVGALRSDVRVPPAYMCVERPLLLQHLSLPLTSTGGCRKKDLGKGNTKRGDKVDLDNDFFVGDAALCYKHEQIGHIFHKLLDSIE